jgi:thiazole synthase ThiGH ThiG subunit
MLYEKFISSPQVKPIVFWNKIGTGTHSVQVLEVGTSNVLISMDVVSGRNTSALTNIPAFATNSVKFYKLQAKEHNRRRRSRI